MINFNLNEHSIHLSLNLNLLISILLSHLLLAIFNLLLHYSNLTLIYFYISDFMNFNLLYYLKNFILHIL